MGSMRLEYWVTELKTSYFSGLTKVDQFLQQYKYDEIIGNIKKNFSNYDYTKMEILVKETVEKIKKNFYDLFTYNQIRSEKIRQLKLYKNAKYNLNVFDENYYSYKLVF
jgi:RNase H-fold protein (predicted Holliday junction resolvase)